MIRPVSVTYFALNVRQLTSMLGLGAAWAGPQPVTMLIVAAMIERRGTGVRAGNPVRISEPCSAMMRRGYCLSLAHRESCYRPGRCPRLEVSSHVSGLADHGARHDLQLHARIAWYVTTR